ncbi:MAG: hypothetical protein COA78_36625 [Blastopirellula sp.]|nr:MAG: hypothetical protein COA78_36625 [Blastopirellula sp.]
MPNKPDRIFKETAPHKNSKPDWQSAIFRDASDGIVIIDSIGRIVDCNPAAESLFGWNRSEVIGIIISELIISEEICDSQRLELESIFQVDEGRFLSKRLDLPARQVDGTNIFIELTIDELKELSEVRFVVMIRDITTIKEAEKALELTQFSVDHAGYSVYWILKDSTIAYGNDQAYRSIGLSREELYSKTAQDVFSNPPINNWDQHWKELKACGVQTYNTIQERQDGTRFPVQITESFIDFNGTEFICATAIDISIQVNSKLILRDGEEKIAAKMEASFDAVFMTDLQSKVSFWNSAAEHLFENKAADIEGYPIQMLLHSLDENSQKGQSEYHINSFSPGQDFVPTTSEMLGLKSDGTFFPIEVSITSINLNNQWWCVGVIRDITERKQIEQKLRIALDDAQAADQAKADFLAVISHEMRTPLNGILGTILLLTQTQLHGEQEEYIDSCRTATDQLRNLIDDILEYSQIESGQFELRESEFVLSEVLYDLIDTYKTEAADNSIEFRFQLDPLLPNKAYGDKDRLRQVLDNLLCNAIKFTDVGYIQLNAKLIEQSDKFDHIKFSVLDTGIGITHEDKERIFNRFEQADASTTRRFGGIGLGLSICKRIVPMLGGELTVSDGPLGGSAFSFTTKFNRGKERKGKSDIVEQMRLLLESSERSIKILLVEDDDLSRKLLERMLENIGFKTATASDGVEAVRKVGDSISDPYDLILMDLMMPRMGGEEATSEIRKIELKLNRRVPIIALTARAMIGDREGCFAADMDGFISKPYELPELLEAMILLLSNENEETSFSSNSFDKKTNKGLGFQKDKLLKNCQYDKEFLGEVVELFSHTSIELNNQIYQSIESKQQQDLIQHIHKLKGAVSNLCSPSVFNEVEQFEISAKNANISWSVIENRYENLNTRLSSIRSELKEFMTTVSAQRPSS